jgi:hypothetical protein
MLQRELGPPSTMWPHCRIGRHDKWTASEETAAMLVCANKEVLSNVASLVLEVDEAGQYGIRGDQMDNPIHHIPEGGQGLWRTR